MPIIQSAISAIILIFSWPTFLFIIAGTLLGLVFGSLPGLGGVVILALLIPVTATIDANMTMALFGAALGGVAFGGSTSAILLNVPGTVSNTATLLDGYPMTKKGESGKAIGASATSSALGALFGIIILVALIPVAQQVILAFAAPEFFVLTIFGISVIAFVVRGDFYKGIAAGGIGITLSFFGYSPFSTEVRFNLIKYFNVPFGQTYLSDGIGIVPATIGLFAIAEVLVLISRPERTIADRDRYQKSTGVIQGVEAVFKYPWLFFQSAAIGTLIGIIPGVGGSVANFMSYLKAKQTNPELIGAGDVRGVIASEAANDAKDGGALIPALAFGIPGSATTALILSALILHGIVPGPELLINELDVVFVLIFSLLISNVLTSLIGLSVADHLTLITVIPITYIVPIIASVSLAGAYVLRGHYGDVVLACLFGLLGFFFVLYDYSRIALIIGLLLGKTAEISFNQSIKAYDSGVLVFFTRPISVVLLLALVVMIGYSLLRNIRFLD